MPVRRETHGGGDKGRRRRPTNKPATRRKTQAAKTRKTKKVSFVRHNGDAVAFRARPDRPRRRGRIQSLYWTSPGAAVQALAVKVAADEARDAGEPFRVGTPRTRARIRRTRRRIDDMTPPALGRLMRRYG